MPQSSLDVESWARSPTIPTDEMIHIIKAIQKKSLDGYYGRLPQASQHCMKDICDLKREFEGTKEDDLSAYLVRCEDGWNSDPLLRIRELCTEAKGSPLWMFQLQCAFCLAYTDVVNAALRPGHGELLQVVCPYWHIEAPIGQEISQLKICAGERCHRLQQVYLVAMDPSESLVSYDACCEFWSSGGCDEFEKMLELMRSLALNLHFVKDEDTENHVQELEERFQDARRDSPNRYAPSLRCMMLLCSIRLRRRQFLYYQKERASSGNDGKLQEIHSQMDCDLREVLYLCSIYDLGPRITALAHDCISVAKELFAQNLEHLEPHTFGGDLLEETRVELLRQSVYHMERALDIQVLLGITADAMCVFANLCRMRFSLAKAQGQDMWLKGQSILSSLGSIQPYLLERFGSEMLMQPGIGGPPKAIARAEVEQHRVVYELLQIVEHQDSPVPTQEVFQLKQRMDRLSQEASQLLELQDCRAGIPTYLVDGLEAVAAKQAPYVVPPR